MVTPEEYACARAEKKRLDEIINAYHRQRSAAFEERRVTNPVFTDEELRYSRDALCPCGHGLAYPKDATAHFYWDCSAILKGIADNSVEHTGRLPFAFYDIKSEDETPGNTRTTRGVFKPKK